MGSSIDDHRPLISVIIPVYNAAYTLPRCVDSILSQTFSDFEILLINDGSSDNSGNICDDYARRDKRIRVFHKLNGGVSSARNVGIEHSRGEWVVFIDSDDWLDSTSYERIISHLKGDLVFFSNYEHAGDNSVMKYQLCDHLALGRLSVECAILRLKNNQRYPFFGFTWNKFFKLSIIIENDIRFVDGFSYFEDEVFTDQYCRFIDGLVVSSEFVYHYSRSNCGLTGQRVQAGNVIQLISFVLKASSFYTNEEIISYEYKRALNLLLLAFSLDESYLYLDKELEIAKSLINGGKVHVGKRLRVINCLGKPLARVILVLYEVITGKKFIRP